MTAEATLRQLRYFAVLGAELNYRRAAEKLFISQPALSSAIKQLERQFGVALLRRTTHEVELTDLGAAWLPQVQRVLVEVDATLASLVTLSRTTPTVLRVGYLIGTGADLLFRIVKHFEAAFPDIAVEPVEYDFGDPTAGLAEGRTEVTLIRPPVDLPGYRTLILESESWVACVPRDHRLANRPEVEITELLDDPIIGAPESAGGWRDYWLAMDARGTRPPRVAGVAATYEAETTLVPADLASASPRRRRPASTTGPASPTCPSSIGRRARRPWPGSPDLCRPRPTPWSATSGRSGPPSKDWHPTTTTGVADDRAVGYTAQ